MMEYWNNGRMIKCRNIGKIIERNIGILNNIPTFQILEGDESVEEWKQYSNI